MKSHFSKKLTDNGFTLVELMIATTVFSVILLVITFGIISIGRIYYKGINSSNTQSIARSVSDDIGQSIQFSGGDISPTPDPLTATGVFCIGDKKYSYVLNKQIEVSDTYALISEIDPGCGTTSTPSINGDGTINNPPREFKSLIGKGWRLSDIKIAETSNSNYEVKVRIVKGDDDLLENIGSSTRCKLGAGSQFCAVSELYTIVNKRL